MQSDGNDFGAGRGDPEDGVGRLTSGLKEISKMLSLYLGRKAHTFICYFTLYVT